MKTQFSVVVVKDGEKQKVNLVCDDEEISIAIANICGRKKTYVERDFYKCFALLRKDNPQLDFYCKGAKLNVHPSSMSSQMSLGLKAYELEVGREPTVNDLVFIFDYEDQGLTTNPDEQRLFYLAWMGA